jgi:hypothetical protein
MNGKKRIAQEGLGKLVDRRIHTHLWPRISSSLIPSFPFFFFFELSGRPCPLEKEP